MHNYQLYPNCHPDGRCPSPDGTEVRPLQLCSDWFYPIPNERIHSCGLPVTHLLTRTLRLPWNRLWYSQINWTSMRIDEKEQCTVYRWVNSWGLHWHCSSSVFYKPKEDFGLQRKPRSGGNIRRQIAQWERTCSPARFGSSLLSLLKRSCGKRNVIRKGKGKI